MLRSLETPELRLVPGRVLMARVLRTDAHGHGALSLAGAVLEAELPKEVREGAQLRLVVRDVTPTRVVLSLSDPAAAAAAAAPPVPLPGGGSLRIVEDEEHQSRSVAGDGVHTLSLRYDAPRLGAVDLRFELDRASLRLAVTVPAGRSHDLAGAHAVELQSALAAGVARTVTVTVSPRREPLDVYA